MQLVPKKWAEFQHYKDRSPPWIKLHRELLNNRDFMCLPLASKALAPLLWLLASESKTGAFEADLDELEFRLRISKKDIAEGLKPLIDKGFFIDASGMLADCLRDAIPEREKETEAKGEKEGENPRKRVAPLQKPAEVQDQTWADWIALRKAKRAPVTQTVINGAIKEAGKAGMLLDDFLQVWCRRGSQGLEAAWLNQAEKQSGKHFNRQEALEASNMAVAQRFIEKMRAEENESN